MEEEQAFTLHVSVGTLLRFGVDALLGCIGGSLLSSWHIMHGAIAALDAVANANAVRCNQAHVYHEQCP